MLELWFWNISPDRFQKNNLGNELRKQIPGPCPRFTASDSGSKAQESLFHSSNMPLMCCSVSWHYEHYLLWNRFNNRIRGLWLHLGLNEILFRSNCFNEFLLFKLNHGSSSALIRSHTSYGLIRSHTSRFGLKGFPTEQESTGVTTLLSL